MFGGNKKVCDTILTRRSSYTFVKSFKLFNQVRKNLLLNIPVEMEKKDQKFSAFWSVKYRYYK